MPQRSASYRLSGVKIDQTNDNAWIVKPASPGWFLPVLGGGVFLFMGIVFLSGGGSLPLASLFFFTIALYFVMTYPLAAQARFDFSAHELNFMATYAIRFPRRIDWSVPFAQIASLSLRPRPFGQSHIAQIQLLDGAELVMDFGRRVAEAEQFVQRFASTTGIAGVSASRVAPSLSMAEATAAQARLQRGIQSWAIWLIVMGFGQMLAAHGLSPWGIVLLIVGAASFYFREAPMFVIYAVTVGWAGLNNLLFTAAPLWKGFALFQAAMVYLIFQQYRQFKRAEKLATEATSVLPIDTSVAPAPTRTERWFPLLALLLGGIALMLFIAALAGVFVLHNRDLLPLVSLLETLAVNMAVLGLATGVAGWLSGASNKGASIIGCVASGLTLTAELALPLLIKALS